MSSSEPRRWAWETFDPASPHAGATVAALLQGINSRAGDVPRMWPHYRAATNEGKSTSWFEAEHSALTLFGLHQQSKTRHMHCNGAELGSAAKKLRAHEKGNPDAVDTHMQAIASTSSASHLVGRLRGLVTLLKSIDQPLDYTRLHRDIANWHRPEQRARIRLRWGDQYYVWR